MPQDVKKYSYMYETKVQYSYPFKPFSASWKKEIQIYKAVQLVDIDDINIH